MGEKPLGWAEDAAEAAAGIDLGGAEVSIGGRADEAEERARPAEPPDEDIRPGAPPRPGGDPPAATDVR